MKFVFKERKSGGIDLAQLDYVRTFVEDYYADDLKNLSSFEQN
ncbi:hypothetical protein [Celeribacter litoreus]|nr:hypothetical protein [Celeribacter litoreus]